MWVKLLPTQLDRTESRGRTRSDANDSLNLESKFFFRSRLLILFLIQRWWNPKLEVLHCFCWKKICRLKCSTENVEFRVEAVADDQSNVRPGKLRHLMQMRQGAICLCVCVYCITFHIHTLPKKFILLPKIRADTFFPWHDSSFKSKRWLTILGTRIMTKRAPQYPSQLQANR